MEGMLSELAQASCTPCEDGTPPLSPGEIDILVRELHGWRVTDGRLGKEFRFADHYATIAFVNAVAWISHHQDHHPDMLVGYDSCRVTYVTHSIGGLSENDFICAAKIEAMNGL